VLNGALTETVKKNRNLIVAKFDEKYVNGEETQALSEKSIMHVPFKK